MGNVVGNGGAADIERVGDRLSALRGVDHQLHTALLHLVDDMRRALGDLVHLRYFDPAPSQILCSTVCIILKPLLKSCSESVTVGVPYTAGINLNCTFE